MRLSTLFAPALFVASIVLTNACTDDEKKIEDPIQASKDSENHEFTVDESGKVNFKLEIVYFNFDDHTLTEQGMERLNALAAYLKDNKDKRLKIEGHCDERGSTEYNLALGQLRAQSVRNYLSGLNIPEERLDAISFGEEKPAEEGRSEIAWAKNRRAEFTFVN